MHLLTPTAVVSPTVQHLSNERLLYYSFTFYNTILMLGLIISHLQSNKWYWIGIFFVILLNNIILLSFPKYRKIYRTLTTLLVFLGSIAAMVQLGVYGFIFLGLNLLYIFGLPNFNRKYDIRDDPYPW